MRSQAIVVRPPDVEHVVEPKPGAGGRIAAAFVAKAPADGYTLAVLPGGHAISAAMYEGLPYRGRDAVGRTASRSGKALVRSRPMKLSAKAFLLRLAGRDVVPGDAACLAPLQDRHAGQLLCEQRRLLHGAEVAAAVEFVPWMRLGIDLVHPAARRANSSL